MEGIDNKRNGMEILKKYRYVLLIFLVGLFLMLMPDTKKEVQTESPVPVQAVQSSLQTQLGEILSKIDGAGKVEVLLTQATGEQTYYQSDEALSTSDNSKNQNRNTVIITNAGREEAGLIRRTDPPIYQGAVVLCQGAQDATVRLSIVEAVSNATGLTTDKITVLKMK